MVSRFEAAAKRPDRATHRRYCTLARLRGRGDVRRQRTNALPPDGRASHPAAVRRSPEEWHGRAIDVPGAYRLLEVSQATDALDER
jgi:hypothetical protein